MTRNTFLLGGLLLATASLATAQQVAVTSTPAIASTSHVTTPTGHLTTTAVAPLPANAYTIQGSGNINYSYNNGIERSFKEEDLKSKEVSKEISVPKGGEIYIENSSRALVVKTWDQPKVKVTTTIYYDGETKLTDEEWLEKVNLSLKTLGSSVKIKSGPPGSTGYSTAYNYPSSSNNVAVFNGFGQNIGSKSNLKRIITVTVPAGSKLDIESKYSDVTLPATIGDVVVDITNGNLEAENLSKLILRSKYSNINVGDIKTAEVEFNNGRFSAKTIDDLDIESKYSTIEMASVKKIVLRSTNDEYELEEAGEVRGRKTYGNLRITKLNGSLEVDGANADIKVRKVGPALSLIKIDNKYADVRIPLRETKSYTVDYVGSYSSVYGNFEKKAVTDEKGSSTTAPNTLIHDGRTYVTSSGALSSNTSKFTAIVGDGKGLKIDMKCQNCTVDFK